MEKQFDIRMKEAKSCSNDEKIKFKSLIKREGHVNIKFFDRLWSNNPLTASIYIKDNLIACGALKKPSISHVRRMFNSSNSILDYNIFQLELGWIATEPEFRRKGCCHSIVKNLLEQNGSIPTFATIRETNDAMRTCLKNFGFQEEGTPFQGYGDYNVVLYILKQFS